MRGKAMSLKAKIRNIAKQKNMSAQVVLQNYMFERFLERLSKSPYKDKFVLKGGILIAALVGIDNRATLDMDAMVRDYPINTESLTKAIRGICKIDIDDNVFFSFSEIGIIRRDDEYGGYRVNIISKYETIITPMQLDITTGDVITPKEVFYSYKMILEEGEIGVWAYNIETVLAEKVETILRRGELNTRARDFYDVYILTKTQSFQYSIFTKALKSTAGHRKSTHIFNNISDRLYKIKESEVLKTRWLKYSKNYPYVSGINFDEVIDALNALLQRLGAWT